MIEVAFSPSFKRALKKRITKNKSLEEKFWMKLELFIHDPFDRSLRTHRLTGALKELWSFSIEYDCRVIFYFLSQKKAVFTDMGNHDEVY